MKKMIIAIMTVFLIMSFTTMVSAEVQTSSSAGAGITFAASNTSGPSITYTPSPSSLVSAFTSATAFTITGGSGKTTTSNGIEYGVVSSENAMYQRVQATSNTVTAADSATSLPGSNWKDKAGNTAP